MPEFDYLWSERYEMGFSSIDEYLDHCEGCGDEPEDELDLCDMFALQIDHCGVIDRMIEDMSEDDEYYIDGWDIDDYESRLDGLPELKAAFENLIREFNAKQHKTCYKTNGKTAKVADLIKG